MSPIFASKINIPSAHPDCIHRPQLIHILNQNLYNKQDQLFLRRLSLIAAPAGYGKSSLLSEWMDQLEPAVAWITFDVADNRLAQFFRYIYAALQTLQPDLQPLDASSLPNTADDIDTALISELVMTLVNDIAGIDKPFLLVFDDYHTLQLRTIHRIVEQFIEHLPPNCSVVISTRSDPPLPLSRLRARRQMAEIRTDDLRFSEDETRSFFENIIRIHLQPQEITSLTDATEGWIAGLQMASLALRGRDDSAAFIENFNGRERFILDYLFEEVFSQQSTAIQSFLLQTAILEHLSGSLCDHVYMPDDQPAAFPNSQAILEHLDSINLFLVPLDHERRLYRYHHLFSDLLLHRLQLNTPQQIPNLHYRAAEWFAANGNDNKAIDHAIAAQDCEKAAAYIETFGYQKFEEGDIQQFTDWLKKLPHEIVLAHPWICILHCWGLIFTGHFDETTPYLQAAEQHIGDVTEQSDEETKDLYGHLAATRAFLCSRSQDAEGILHYSNLANHYINPNRYAVRSYLAFFQGTARYKTNEYAAAQNCWRESARLGMEVGNTLITVNSLVTLAELHRVQGRLNESFLVCEEAIALGMDARGNPLPLAAEAYVCRARLYYEWNNLSAAQKDADTASVLMKFYAGYDLLVEHRTWLAALHMAQGEMLQAGTLIHEIENNPRQAFYKSAAVFLAQRMQYYLATGNMDALQRITQNENWDPHAKNLFAWADVFVAYARVLLARNKVDEAQTILDSCREKLESYGLWMPAYKIMLLQACITHRRQQPQQALEQIQHVLTLTQPQGFIRIYLDSEPEIRQMLRQLHKQGSNHNNRLYATISHILSLSTPTPQPLTETSIPLTHGEADLIAPLTDREVEVLQLISHGLSNKELAAKLVVTVGTVKTHTSNIYRKLDVIGRTKALAKARDLNII